MEEEEKEPNIANLADSMNPDALEAVLGDDFVEIDEEEIIIISDANEDDDLDIAFSHDDPRDWY